MAKTVIKNTTTHAVVKVVGAAATITLADMAFEGVTPTGASIKSVFYASDWNEGLDINRNSANVLNFLGSGFIDFQKEFGVPITEEHDQSISVDSVGSATNWMVVIEFLKIL